MNREHMIAAVQSQMPERRWIHTVGVMQSAVELADRFGADSQKAEIAAILHDVCKYWPVAKQAEVLHRHQMDLSVLDYAHALWHAPAGACIARVEYDVQDGEILDAIRYHTSGRVGMTLVDKIVCLADYIEPGRNFPGVEHIRELATHHLEQALVAGFDSTLSYLIQQQEPIYPVTIAARNDLLKHK